MIEKMKKLLFMGAISDQEKVVSTMQKIGVVQIDPYKGENFNIDGRGVDRSKSNRYISAVKLLNRYEATVDIDIEELSKSEDKNDIDQIALEITNLHKELSSLEEEKQQLSHKKATFNDWGDFKLSLIKDIEKKSDISIQFWEISTKLKSLIQFDKDKTVEVITIKSGKIRDYFITFSKNKISLEHALEVSFDYDLSSLKERVNQIEKKMDNIKNSIIKYYPYLEDIKNAHLKELNKINKDSVNAGAIKTMNNQLFTLQGWIPEKYLDDLKDGLKETIVEVIEIAPEKNEIVPTAMSNKPYPAMGQDLVEIYDTPSYKDWDPSSWIFFSFTIFFAMIMADGGYGLVLLLLMLFLKLKIKKPSSGLKRFLNMSIILSGATFVYGVVSGGFFGTSETNKAFGWLIKLKTFDGADIPLMMKISILIGMIHISISLILKTLRMVISEKEYLASVSNIAWIVAIWSFYFWYIYNDVESMKHISELSLNILYGSFGVVFLTSAGSFKPSKLFPGGLMGLYNGVQFFSDVLSYIRIFALGLSGTLLALTFNDMGGQLWDAGVLGMIFAPLVIIFGHLLNIILCIMGGVIHGLRLNFLEWYRWSFDGGGKPFQPLKDLLTKN